MSKEIVEDKMTQLTELLGDIVERGCADELDSEPTTDLQKSAGIDSQRYTVTRIFATPITPYLLAWKSTIRRSEIHFRYIWTEWLKLRRCRGTAQKFVELQDR